MSHILARLSGHLWLWGAGRRRGQLPRGRRHLWGGVNRFRLDDRTCGAYRQDRHAARQLRGAGGYIIGNVLLLLLPPAVCGDPRLPALHPARARLLRQRFYRGSQHARESNDEERSARRSRRRWRNPSASRYASGSPQSVRHAWLQPLQQLPSASGFQAAAGVGQKDASAAGRAGHLLLF